MSDRLTDARIVLRQECLLVAKRRQVFLTFAAVLVLMCFNMVIVGSQLKQAHSQAVFSVIAQTLFTHYPVSVSIIFFLSLSQQVFLKDRYTRSLESLLATPLHPWSIWLGKSLACWTFGWIGAALSCAGAWVVFSMAVDSFTSPGPGALAFFLTIGPLLSAGIFLLLGFANLGLRNATAANAVFIYLGIGFMFLSSFRARALVLSPRIAAWFLIGAAATLVLALYFGSRLSAEDMILANYRSGSSRKVPD